MGLAHDFAAWAHRCLARFTASDRGLIESDLQDFELMMRDTPAEPPRPADAIIKSNEDVKR